MTTFTRTWNAAYEANPADSQNASQGAARIREIKTDVQERLEVDHSHAGDANDGAHKKVTLLEQAGNPTLASNTGFMFTKDVSGVTELFYMNSGGLVIQMTTGGLFNIADLANLPVIIPLGVSTAVNEITVRNAAAGSAPDIFQSGAGSVGLNIESINILAAALQTTVTNGDVTLTRNGTGNWIIAGAPIYGKYILDTPEILSTATTEGSWVTINSTTLNTAQAKRALITIRATSSDTTIAGVQDVSIYIRKTGSALVANDATIIGQGAYSNGFSSYAPNKAAGTRWVNLDTSYNFDYLIEVTQNGLRSASIVLAGYEK